MTLAETDNQLHRNTVSVNTPMIQRGESSAIPRVPGSRCQSKFCNTEAIFITTIRIRLDAIPIATRGAIITTWFWLADGACSIPYAGSDTWICQLAKGIAAIGAETIKQLCDPDRYLQGACLSGVVVMPRYLQCEKNYFDFSGAVEE